MAALTLDDIAAAGLRLVDRGGAPALTMRAVADELGVSAMALYHHVANKSELLELLVERAYQERPLPAPSGRSWREDILALAAWMRESVVDHPALPFLRQRHNVWTPSLLAFGEYWVGLWQRSGLDFDRANRAAAASIAAVIGFVHQEVRFTSFELPDDSMVAWLPNMRGILEQGLSLSEDFDLAVQSVVDGMYQRFLRASQELDLLEPAT